MVDFFANCKLNRSSRRQRFGTLPPLAPATPGGSATLISTPQLPNSPTRKLANYQTVKLPLHSPTRKLSNSQTVKLSNFPSTLQLSTPQLRTPHLSPQQHYLNSSFFIIHSSLFILHSSFFILHSSLFI